MLSCKDRIAGISPESLPLPGNPAGGSVGGRIFCPIGRLMFQATEKRSRRQSTEYNPSVQIHFRCGLKQPIESKRQCIIRAERLAIQAEQTLGALPWDARLAGSRSLAMLGTDSAMGAFFVFFVQSKNAEFGANSQKSPQGAKHPAKKRGRSRLRKRIIRKENRSPTRSERIKVHIRKIRVDRKSMPLPI